MPAPAPFLPDLAFLIGVTQYSHLPPLRTPVRDIERLQQLLEVDFNYQVQSLQNPGKTQIADFFDCVIPQTLAKHSPRQRKNGGSVIIYFAGHGVAMESETGIKGCLMPADAAMSDPDTWYNMSDMLIALDRLDCRHLALILDCCFSGAIRWAGKHRSSMKISKNAGITKNHYHYFTENRSWQVLTSTAPDQTALDFVRADDDSANSPFAQCLMDGLSIGADWNKDKVITLAELFIYMQEEMSRMMIHRNHRQNVGLFPLEKHDNGEFLWFKDRDFNPDSLEPAKMNNPYKGLDSYNEADKNLFFGRDKAIEELTKHAQGRHFIVVSGASGTGKSSLVKAGLAPELKTLNRLDAIPVVLPGRNPLAALQEHQHAAILIVDQLEQLITQSDASESELFWKAIQTRYEARQMTVFTVRIDYEAQLNIPKALQTAWQNGRYIVPLFSAEELREIIVTPTMRVGRFIDPLTLVDDIVSEVIQYPGALPLLSFTMAQLFERCNRDTANLYPKITARDYAALGGVTGALQQSADAVYESLAPDAQSAMRKLMLRMISLSGGETAGRRVLLEELQFDDAAEDARVRLVKDELEKARLIHGGTDINGNDFIEPSHDALVRTWQRVKIWVTKFGADHILLRDKLQIALHEFKQNKESDHYLWHHNPSLKTIFEIQQREAGFWNSAEMAFAAKSEAKQKNEMEALKAERDEAVRIRKIAEQSVEDLKKKEEDLVNALKKAEAERKKAVAGMLAVKAGVVSEKDNTLALRLAQLAVKATDVPTAESVLVARDIMANGIFYEDIYCFHREDYYLDISRDGRYVFGRKYNPANKENQIDYENNITVWNSEGQELFSIPDPERKILTFEFSADNNYFSTINIDHLLTIWNFQGKKINEFQFGDFVKCAFSFNENAFIIVYPNNKSIRPRKYFFQGLADHTFSLPFEDDIYDLKYSPNGKLMVGTLRSVSTGQGISADQAKCGIIYDTFNNKKIEVDGNSPITDIAFSQDSRYILFGTYNGWIKIWKDYGIEDNTDFKEYASWKGHSDSVISSTIVGEIIITSGKGEGCRCWDFLGNELGNLKSGNVAIWSIIGDYKKTGSCFITRGQDGKLKRWNLDTQSPIKVFEQKEGVKFVSFSPDGRKVLLHNFDGVEVWGVDKTKICSLEPYSETTVDHSNMQKGHIGRIFYAVFSADGNNVITAGEDKNIIFWDLQGREVKRLSIHTDAVMACAVTPDGDFLISGSWDKTVVIWDMHHEAIYHTYDGFSTAVLSLDFSLKKYHILVCTEDGDINVFNAKGEKLYGFETRAPIIGRPKFSPDGRYILVCDSDGAKIYEGEKYIQTFQGHTGKVFCVDFSSDGNWVATGGEDKTARIWNLDGTPTPFLAVHDDKVIAVSFSPDGKYLLTGSLDKSAILWNISWADFEFEGIHQLTEKEKAILGAPLESL